MTLTVASLNRLSSVEMTLICELWKNELGVWKWDIGISHEVLFIMNGNEARQLKELETILEDVVLRQEQ